MRRTSMGLAALLAAASAAAWAQHPVPLGEAPEAAEETPKDKAPKAAKQDARAAELAERYGFEAEEVSKLRGKGLGWGETEHALGIARKADKPLDEVVALREKGMGWGKIAQSYGFKLGEVKREKGAEAEQLRDAPRDAPERGRERRMKGAPERPRHSPRPERGRGGRGPKGR